MPSGAIPQGSGDKDTVLETVSEGRERPYLLHASVATFLSNGGALALNLASGVVLARGLGVSGRGQLAAVLASPNIGGWIFGMGAAQAISFHAARSRSDAPSLFATWLLLGIPLSVFAIGCNEIILPWLLAAQDSSTVAVAHIWACSVAFGIYVEILSGLLLGCQDFVYYNVSRLAAPAVIAIGYLLLWRLHHLSVVGAVATTGVAYVVLIGAMGMRATHAARPRRPSAAIARRSLIYGLKAHSNSLGLVTNARLDVVVIPAFLGAASVGLYAVATNAAWIIVTAAGALYTVVLPLAARHQHMSRRIVSRALGLSLAVASVLAVVLWVFATPALTVVYGPAFSTASTALRWLLPGCVLYAGAHILWSGLSAENRPLVAGLAQVPGVLVTVIGLSVFVPHGGIVAAAIVSSVAYTVVFAFSIAAYWTISSPGSKQQPIPSGPRTEGLPT